MAGDDLATEALADRRLGEMAQGRRRGIGGLVAMQVDIEAALGGKAEEPVEGRIEPRLHQRHEAEHAAMRGHDVSEA